MNAPTRANGPPSPIPWPPILMALTLAAGLALDAATRVSLIDRASSSLPHLAGAAIVMLALANDVWCFRILSRHQTTILPHRAASCLVTEGPFRLSRNPIYVSHVALIFGLGLFLGSPFTLLLTPVLAFCLTKLAIEPEERHLLAKFGDHYRSYMARTRRWL
ncbi:MAG: isoprenylcysteine carboxylmethyltransferase family protein [Alphaproteobacteria bacterium]|nr:isoprenylcysteine carboxylmethyltransferase family protein [Alphaproteobacteria bacterium]MBM3652489.1 isoprenylcysteine carboxylmethyltransferase family protein [Alphaproteobacteria bacterium]